MSFFNKVSNLYKEGKEKLKQKLTKKVENDGKSGKTKSNQNINMKVGSVGKNNTPQKTKITPIKDKKEEDIFKIDENNDGKEFTYKIQDIDSDEDEEDEVEEKNNETNEDNNHEKQKVEGKIDGEVKEKKEKNEYVLVDKKKEEGKNAQSHNQKLEEFSSVNKEEDILDAVADEFFKQEQLDIFTISHRLLIKVSFI